MAVHEVRFEEVFAAPREKVFEFFAEHSNMRKVWGGRWERIQEGTDEPNGLNSVRLVRAGGATFEETIVSFQRPSLIEYTVTKGGMMKSHLSRMEFSDDAGGTRLVYTIRFEPKVMLAGRLLTGVFKARWNRGVGNVRPNL